MNEQEMELSVGDIVQIGDYVVTVIEIEGEDVSFRIDEILNGENPIHESRTPRPR